MSRAAWALVPCALVVLAGCINSPVRRSAFVPRNKLPANHGAPIGPNGLKAFADVNTFEIPIGGGTKTIEDLFESIPTEGAAGLFIPKLHLGAGVYGAPNKYLEIGAQMAYTNLKWAEPNLQGVLDFPAEHDAQSILMGGPGLRVNIPLGDDVPVTPAILVESNIATIPQAVYVRTNENTVDEDGNIVVAEYAFERIDRKTFLLSTLALHVSVSVFEEVSALVLGGLTQNVKNIGFDPNIENLENDTLSSYFHGFVGGGAEVRIRAFFATLLLHGAFGQPREIRFGLSGSFSVGVVLK